MHGDRLKVRGTAAPERGEADQAVIEVISGSLGGVPVAVRGGATNRAKTLSVGMDPAGVVDHLGS